MGLGLKDTPSKSADKVIAESKPLDPTVVIVLVTVPPSLTVIALGDALMAKLGSAARSALIRLEPFGLPQPVAKS